MLKFNGNTLTVENLDINSRYIEQLSVASIASNILTIDLSSGNLFTCSLDSNIDTLTITNIPATSSDSIGFTLIFTADGTARSVNWPLSIKWAGSLPPTLTTTNNKQDIFSFITTDNGTSWLAFVGGQNY